MATFYIIHGAYGNPDENWFPYLKTHLEQNGHTVHVPQFSTPEGQTLEHWKQIWGTVYTPNESETILIGHSIGCAFILSLLEEISVSASYLVSPFIQPLGNPDFDVLNATFIDKPFNWELIKQHCDRTTIFYSDTDPYVPADIVYTVAKQLNITPIHIPNAGHFNTAAGYTTFPLLYETIIRNTNTGTL